MFSIEWPVLISVLGGLLGIIAGAWRYAMKPYDQRINELEEQDEEREHRLREVEMKTSQHDIKIETLTNSINQLITKMDVFLQQLINRSNK